MVRPTSVDELAGAIRSAKGSIVPMGASTQMEFGNPLRGADSVIDMRGLARITDYNPADLTIHVEAGVTLGQLQQAVEANNQALPLDPWNGPEATIGGIAAANTQGPLRAVGTIRDWIIGMRVVHADGTVSKTGGKVVKNVTGYDLAKLYTGSLGSLAVIAEISLKLRASFGKTVTAIAEFDRVDAALARANEIRHSMLQPLACEIIGPRPAVWLRFGEHPRAVEWQLKNLPQADWKFFEGPQEKLQWDALRLKFLGMGPIVVRVVGVPSAVTELIQAFKPAGWIAHALNGIIFMTVQSVEEVRQIRQRYPAIVERAPLTVRRSIPTFGVTGSEARLMREMKRTLDPDGRLNPGRHVDGE
jgi:glycolate oxidase FAD binding subunit